MLFDANLNPHFTLDSFNVEECRPTAFTGASSNTRGDKDGTSQSYKLYDVVGDVLVRIFGVCTVDLTGASGTLEVGVTGNTAALIAQTTATSIDAGMIWSDSSPTLGVDTLASVLGPYLVVNGLDIYEKSATTDIASGNIYYICLWRPVSHGSSVVSAV